MNVNGARFQLLLGRADWGRCMAADGPQALPLAAWWDGTPSSPALVPALPAWDAAMGELTLQPLAIELPDTATEQALALDARRGAAADRHGNVYRVGDDRASLRVMSAGNGGDSEFWPAPPADCAPQRVQARLDFTPAAPAAAPLPETFLALAVTADDYLVAAYARGAERGFLAFDLVAGGEPVRTVWPLPGFQPFDMAARCGGGVWVLDRAHRLLWELDCSLSPVATGQPALALAAAQVDDFQPLQGAARTRAAQSFPGGIALGGSPAWTTDAIAVEAWGERDVLLLDRDDAGRRSRVLRLRRRTTSWEADASGWMERLVAHDFVLGTAALAQGGTPRKRLYLGTTGGNQARAFDVVDGRDSFGLRAGIELFPLRRYAGRALLSIKGQACYDSGFGVPTWTRIVQQARSRFAAQSECITPVFDAGEAGITWDRLLLDACLPADTTVEVWSRAGDERVAGGGASPAGASAVVGAWSREPALQLRSTGPELPWLRADAARETRREAGVGTWELLLQNAQGRYLQIRLRLVSRNGTASPRLRALRAWAPRFSYPKQFLPAVYREDPAAGGFLERWLANPESTLTQIEDRIATAQALFDPRSVPGAALSWLAGWFELALDPSWDERRQRLFVRRAMDYFRWRGTVHGLRLALDMAFDACIAESRFDGPQPGDGGPRSIRIVETYQSRLVGALVAGDPGSAEGLREVAAGDRWSPAEGNAGLVRRYAQVLGQAATSAQQVLPFALVSPADAAAAATWNDFCARTLGFVPAAGAAQRQQWQAFLAARYGQPAAMNTKRGTSYTAFVDVALPADEPADAVQAKDWGDFCAQTERHSTAGRWADFLARRYRRIDALRQAWRSGWTDFARVPSPDALPASQAGQTDWWQFEGLLLAMQRSAHRFSVLLPVDSVSADPYVLAQRLALARRIVELEKPAHTVFDVRFYWAFNRVGEARLGLDTQIGAGSRASELIPDAVLGRAYIGASFVDGAARPRAGDRLALAC